MRLYSVISTIGVFLVYAFTTACSAHAEKPGAITERSLGTSEIVIDSVLASVNGKPITLRDLNSALKSRRSLTLKEVTTDSEASQTLDRLIFERVLEAEAELRRIKVAPGEVQSYVAEVAKRNEMSPEQFELALRAQNINPDEYKQQIRIEILKSRLASQLTQAGAGVSQEEIDRYIEQHPELSKSGTKVKLRQIMVLSSAHADADARLNEIQSKLKNGAPFEKVAREYSDGPEALDGGSLGVMALEDLNPALFDIVFSLHEGEFSAAVKGDDGYRIVLLEKRYIEESSTDEQLREEVRKTLESQKMEVKLNNFFANDIAKHHTIDKKI